MEKIGISDTKIKVYKVIDDESSPGGIVYNNPQDVIEHFKCWLENTSLGEGFMVKVIIEEMTYSQFKNLPEYR